MLIKAQDVAERLNVCTATVYEWAAKQKIPAVRIGRTLRFRESDVEKIAGRGA